MELPYLGPDRTINVGPTAKGQNNGLFRLNPGILNRVYSSSDKNRSADLMLHVNTTYIRKSIYKVISK